MDDGVPGPARGDNPFWVRHAVPILLAWVLAACLLLMWLAGVPAPGAGCAAAPGLPGAAPRQGSLAGLAVDLARCRDD